MEFCASRKTPAGIASQRQCLKWLHVCSWSFARRAKLRKQLPQRGAQRRFAALGMEFCALRKTPETIAALRQLFKLRTQNRAAVLCLPEAIPANAGTLLLRNGHSTKEGFWRAAGRQRSGIAFGA
jgi:hypothetical protein